MGAGAKRWRDAGRVAGLTAMFCAVLAPGCREEPLEAPRGPTLLTAQDIARFERAAADLGVSGVPPEELAGIVGIGSQEISYTLMRHRFSPQEFLDMAETMFLARHGRRILAELPRDRRALARALQESVRRDTGNAGDAALRAALAREAEDDTESAALFVRTVLRNAEILEHYEAARARERSAQ